MFMVIRRYRVQPHSTRAITKAVRTGFVPIVSRMPALRHYYLVRTGNGEVASVSVFEERASADESTRRAAEWVQENLAEYVVAPPDVMIGEILVET